MPDFAVSRPPSSVASHTVSPTGAPISDLEASTISAGSGYTQALATPADVHMLQASIGVESVDRQPGARSLAKSR